MTKVTQHDARTAEYDPANTPALNLEITLAIQRKADLGEGAIWNPASGELWWVDIEKHLLYTYDPVTQKECSFDMGQRIGTVVPAHNGNAIVALQDGVYEYDPRSRQKKLVVANPEDPSLGNRFNDGKCDPMGRLWAGTHNMQDIEGRAALYQIDAAGKLTKMLTGVSCSNGICWSQNNSTMYYIDTPTRKLQAFDFDPASGQIANRRDIIHFPAALGMPDGMTMDEHGMLWIAMWKGGSVTRWDPDTGELLQSIPVPAINITSCAFGGEDLDTLYITSASVDMTPEERLYYPLAGCVFSCKPGIKGLPACFFGDGERMSSGGAR